MPSDQARLNGPFGMAPDRALAILSPGSTVVQPEGNKLDQTEIWRVLWVRRYWVLGASLAGLVAAVLYSLLQTPLYRSTSVLELNPPSVPILSEKGKAAGDYAVQNTDYEFLPTQYGLLKSRNLARRVVEDLNLVQDQPSNSTSAEQRLRTTTDQVADSIVVKPVPDSRLVELTYVSKSPTEAARIVNGYADSFLSSTLDRRYEATATAREFLKKRLETVRVALDASERKLVDYAKQNHLITTNDSADGGTGTTSLTGASLTSINEALARAQEKRVVAEQRYRQAGSITEVNQSTTALRQQKAQLEAEYQEKSSYLKEDYPDMVRLRNRINGLERGIRQEAGNASGSLRAEYQAALSEERSLQAKVHQLSANVLDERERSIQYNMLQRELDTNRSLYNALLERYNEVGVASGVGTPQASILDRGEVPKAPFSPNVPRNLGFGFVLGLLVGAVFAFIYDFITDTIRTPQDVREKLGLAPIGVIPGKKRKEELAELLADQRSAMSEAYSSLLTALQFATHNGIPKSVLVTSTTSAEGKSTTSFVLARQLAELGKKVLLLDADMRKPSFMVEEAVDVGLSRLLSGGGRANGHIFKTSSENLWLMPSGPVAPNPAQILNSQRTEEVLDELRLFFDVIIVDAPPVQGFADAIILGSKCQGVLFVVESGKARRKAAQEAIYRLQSSGSVLLGSALTKYKSSSSEYGYGYGYAYGEDQKALGDRQGHELARQLFDGSEK